MKSMVSYLCSDGLPHIFDASDRVRPLCGQDVFVVSMLSDERTDEPMCEDCAIAVVAMLEGRT